MGSGLARDLQLVTIQSTGKLAYTQKPSRNRMRLERLLAD
jgi:hypothetical protein